MNTSERAATQQTEERTFRAESTAHSGQGPLAPTVVAEPRREYRPLLPAKVVIESKVLFIRGHKVMLDSDLARLYGVETKALNRAVKRNRERFPPDFMFQLTGREALVSRCQIGTLKQGQNLKYLPYAFTEHGVAMLSSVLRSDRAIHVNIQIMRTFAKLRQIVSANQELARRLDEMEKRYDGQFKLVFDAIRELMEPAEEPGRQIGFRPED